MAGMVVDKSFSTDLKTEAPLIEELLYRAGERT